MYVLSLLLLRRKLLYWITKCDEPDPNGISSFRETVACTGNPGFDGGAEWGGAAYDPTTGVLYVNSDEMPN
jgi:hypothetical protein